MFKASSREAYRILVNSVISAQSRDRILNVEELRKLMAENAGTIEIAPGRSLYDWIRDYEEDGFLVRISPGRYRIVKDIVIMSEEEGKTPA